MPPLGTRALLFWKWSCRVAFSKALFALFGQFKSLRRIYSRSFWQAAKCNFAPRLALFFFEWRNEFVINALEFKVNSLFREQQNGLWVLPLSGNSCLSLRLPDATALASRIMIWRLFWPPRVYGNYAIVFTRRPRRRGKRPLIPSKSVIVKFVSRFQMYCLNREDAYSVCLD